MKAFLDPYDVTPAATTGWQTVSLSSYLPAEEVVGVVVEAIAVSINALYVGARIPGATQPVHRQIDANDVVGGKTVIYAGVNTSRQVELYRDDANVSYYLMGYFWSNEAYFKTSAKVISPDGTAGWVEKDASADSDMPSGAEGLYGFLISYQAGRDAGGRIKGCALDGEMRSMGLTYCSGIVIGLDSNAKYELYYADTTLVNDHLKIVGYAKGNAIYSYTTPEAITPSTYGSYVAKPTTELVDRAAIAGRVYATVQTQSYNHSIRAPGSSHEKYVEPAWESGEWFSKLDGFGQAEIKSENANLAWILTTAFNYVFPPYPRPSYSLPEDIEFATSIIEFESGAEQAIRLSASGRRSWRVGYENLTYTQVDLLWDFVQDVRGTEKTFYFSLPPDHDSLIAAQFVENYMSRDLFARTIYNSDLKIREVLNAT